MHVTVCICTYLRPRFLERLLKELSRQESKGSFTFSVVVVDNDHSESARPVTQADKKFPFKISYFVEPRRNIALARNKCLENAAGDFIAFIDDDEFPEPDWLIQLLTTCLEKKVDGVLGPVRPSYEEEPPPWITRGEFHGRPIHETGFVMDWRECRTGNVLFRRDILRGVSEPFRAQFGTGSEDVDFFRRMTESGHAFIWCNEAVVYETIPANRCRRSFMLKRALLRGGNSIKQPRGRLLGIAKTFIALPVYTLALPFLLVAGHHHFMRFLIKLCDHTGRLLALMRMNPIRQREM